MAEQYNFTQGMRGPEVSISLFGDAAKAGVATGNALPTTTQAIIEGAVKGYQTGQEIQKNNAAIAYQEQALKNAQIEEQVKVLQLEVAQKNHQQNLELTEAKLRADKAKLDGELDVMNDKKTIAELLASPDPYKRREVLTNPKLSDAMFSDSEYANKVLGNLFATTPMTQQERDAAFERFNLLKTQEQRFELQKLESKNKETLANKAAEARFKLASDGEMSYLLNYSGEKSLEGLLANIKTYPAGVKKYDSKTGLLDEQAPDQDVTITGTPGTFNVFIKGKKAPINIKDSLNDLIQLSQNDLRERGLLPTAKAMEAGQQVKAAATAAADKPLTAALTDTVRASTPTPAAGGVATPAPYGVSPGSMDASIPKEANPIVAQRQQDLLNRAQNNPNLRERLVQKGMLKESESPAATPAASPTTTPPVSLPSPTRAVANSGAVPQQSRDLTVTPTPQVLKQQVAYTYDALPPVIKKEVSPEIVTTVLSNKLLRGLDPLYQAVAAVESGGKNNAKSPTGVRGLFQVTKATANDLKINRDIPEQNVAGGVAYLDELTERYRGNKTAALMAYNVGLGVVDTIINMTNASSYEDLVFGLKYLKDKGLYPDYLTDKKIKEAAKYPLKVYAYLEAFSNLAHV